MKKSRLTLIIIVAIFMVPILSFEASARNAYGATCTSPDDCDSGICINVNPEITPPNNICGCLGTWDCSSFPGTVCNTVHKVCINSDAKKTGESCTSNSHCLSAICKAGKCACEADADCPTGNACVSSLCKLKNNARCSSNDACASGFCYKVPATTTFGLCNACRTNADCGTGKTCKVSTGRCSSTMIALEVAPREYAVMPSGSSGTGTPSRIQSLIDEINEIITGIKARMVRLRL
jgi:hypothetical protein